jgi:tRNA-dihydrouridine synthase
MIGRHCIRNPWIFRQLREHFAGEPIYAPTMADVREYIEDLFVATSHPDRQGRYHINHLKKFLNFVGLSVDTDGQFLHAMRRAKSKEQLDEICDRHLIDGGRAAEFFPSEPIKGLVARPNCETAKGCAL